MENKGYDGKLGVYGMAAVFVAAVFVALGLVVGGLNWSSTPPGPGPHPSPTVCRSVTCASGTPKVVSTPCITSVCKTATPTRLPISNPTATRTATRLPVSNPTATPTKHPVPISTIPAPVPSAASTRVPVPVVTAVATSIPPIPTVPAPVPSAVGTRGVGERVQVELASLVGVGPTATATPGLLCGERVQAGDKHIALEWYALDASPVYTYWRDPINVEVQLVTNVLCGVVGERNIIVDWEVGEGAPSVVWTP